MFVFFVMSLLSSFFVHAGETELRGALDAITATETSLQRAEDHYVSLDECLESLILKKECVRRALLQARESGGSATRSAQQAKALIQGVLSEQDQYGAYLRKSLIGPTRTLSFGKLGDVQYRRSEVDFFPASNGGFTLKIVDHSILREYSPRTMQWTEVPHQNIALQANLRFERDRERWVVYAYHMRECFVLESESGSKFLTFRSFNSMPEGCSKSVESGAQLRASGISLAQ